MAGQDDKISSRLSEHTVIGLDSCVFIYHVEAHPRYSSVTRPLLAGIEQGRWKGVISPITLMELTVRPWQLGLDRLARQYELLLLGFPHLLLVDVDRHIARKAAQLRAVYNVRPADALLVATALEAGATVFVTNDLRLNRLASLLEICQLDEMTEKA